MTTAPPIPNTHPSVLLLTDRLFAQQASIDLQGAGYYPIVEQAHQNWQTLEELEPVMVVVERSWMGELGISFCRQLRQRGKRIPILMLVETEAVEERVACLEAGADDYLLKPYNREELLSLINIYLQPTVDVKQQLRFGELILDLSTRQAIRDGRTIDLTMKEFELLKYLISNPRKVLTRDEIIENVWGYDYRGESNVIEVYIRYLRLKIEQPDHKRIIQTVRGVGYVLREP
ncbi:MAG: response regulator transcription factor NblR [Pleurocapsa sp.]